MSTLSQFAGGTAMVPKALVNNTSAGSAYDMGLNLNPAQTVGIKVATSGALVAGTLVTVLSLTGRGSVGFLACVSTDATSRAHRMKVTIDDVVAYDATSTAYPSSSVGVAVIGGVLLGSSNTVVPVMDQVPFNKSFLVEYASSVTETGKTNFGYVYRTY